MTARVLVTLFALASVMSLVGTFAQECSDHDGDGEQFGFSCPASSDCDDRSWTTFPGATETCDGHDNDCDLDLDEGCPRACGIPLLSGYDTLMPHETEPDDYDSVAGLTGAGILVYRIQEKELSVGDGLGFARVYDRRGRPLGPMEVIGDQALEDPREQYPEIETTADRALLVWQKSGGLVEDDRLFARVVDGFGRPIGAGPIDVPATVPPHLVLSSAEAWHFHEPIWNGEEFVVFWSPEGDGPSIRNYVLMTRIGTNGELLEPVARIVLDDIDGNRSTLQRVRGVWTGDRYLLGAEHDIEPGIAQNLRVLTVSREGTLLSNVPVPVDVRASTIQVVKGPGRGVLAWRRSSAEPDEVRARFVDFDGSLTAGISEISLATIEEFGLTNFSVGWSGEQFLLAYDRRLSGGGYRWLAVRFLPDGTLLDADGVPLQSSGANGIEDLLWTGTEWVILSSEGTVPATMVLKRVVCDCGDVDGDGMDACFLNDCDDNDPFAYPGAPEICFGGGDDDCDGATDCDDTDCPASGIAPGEIIDLRPDGDQWVWTAGPSADRFDVARGRLSDLVARGDYYNAECAGSDLTTASWDDDGRNPARGEVLWYLVRAENDPCTFSEWNAAGTAVIEVCR